jgi:outer membrane immunogenic protein
VMAAGYASAADLPQWKAPPPPPPAPQFSWTGCHIGVDFGVGNGMAQWTDTQPDGNIDNDLLATTARTAEVEQSGAVAGGQIGCDVQLGDSFVLGVAGLMNWSNVTAEGMDQFNQTWTLRDNTDWYGSVTGRAGVTVDNALVYAKGGVAFAHNNFEIENSGVTLGTPSDVRTGWTVGAGLEWAFSPHWSAVLEGNYYGFGAKTELFDDPIAVAGAFVNPPFTINVKPSFETLTLGVNYRFGVLGP